jgi:diaminopropionate ammonia-lyase
MAVSSLGAHSPLSFHRRLPGYAVTPLRSLDSLAKRLGLGAVLAKLESDRLELPSFKMLGASWAIYRAIQEHLGLDFEPWKDIEELAAKLAPYRPLTLVAATDGNHGRAVAHMARLLNLQSRIFVPRGTSAARIEAIEDEGALCIVVEGDYDAAVARSAQEADERTLVISDTSWEGYEQVPAWVTEGYSTLYQEIDAQIAEMGIPGPDLVVVPIGVGALAAAAVAHYRSSRPLAQPKILGVEPIGAHCVLESVRAGHLVTLENPRPSIMAGLNCDTPSRIAWPLVSKGIDAFVAIDDEAAKNAMRTLAEYGVVAGETGAAATGGLLELLQGEDGSWWRKLLELDETSTVVVICTEGATDEKSYETIVGRKPEQVDSGANSDPFTSSPIAS